MSQRTAIVLCLILTLFPPVLLSQARRQIVSPTGHQLDLPFSPGVFSGDFLFISGTLGNRAGTQDVSGDTATQTRQALENIGSVLRAAGLDFSHVVSSNVYLADMRDYAAMNEVYRSFFPNSPPTRATVEAGLAVRDARIEISMVASRSGRYEVVRPSDWPAPGSPYSFGIKVGNALFVAGMVSEDPVAGTILPGNAAQQSRRALENLGRVLKTAGMSYEDVTGCRVYLDDTRDFEEMNLVFRQFFQTEPPVRATVQAHLALPDLRVEMQCTASSDETRKVVGDAVRGRPFSPAIQAGDKLFVAGMLGRGKKGLAKGDVKAQTRQALENIRTTLRSGGLDLFDIVDATVFITDVRYYADMNEVYRELLPKTPPARTTVALDLMSPDALVEIMVTAVRK